MKTFMPKVDADNRKWWVIDLDNAVLGHVAIKVADILRGKNKPIFTPHLDTGDHVVIVNARNVKVTGKNKPDQMKYYRYSGYPGGLRTTTFAQMMQKKPEDVFRLAVRRMLPKNKLGRKMIKKLHVYADAGHPHKAQNPETLTL